MAPSTPGSTAPLTNGIPATVDLASGAVAAAPNVKGTFRLQTQLSVAFSQCLEGNKVAPGAYLGGATVMDDCQNVSGEIWTITAAKRSGFFSLRTIRKDQQNQCLQADPPSATAGGTHFADCSSQANQNWRFVDAGHSTYRLQTEAAIAANQCLEGNHVDQFALVNGAAFLDGCKATSGQIWTLAAESSTGSAKDRNLAAAKSNAGHVVKDLKSNYRLTAKSSPGKCLEGNQVSAIAVLKGASFLEDCRNVAGQSWKFVETDEQGVYTMQTKQSANAFQCFDGSEMVTGAVLGGAAHMGDCSNDAGQLWMLVTVADGQYRLQTKQLAASNSCLEGNRLDARSILAGAAFMDTCQNVTGQLWTVTAVKGN